MSGEKASAGNRTPPGAAGSELYTKNELSTAAVQGGRAVIGSRILIEATNFLSVIAIARLVSPSQAGRAAVALVFTLLAYVLTFEGFGSALVQRADATDIDYRTATSLSLLSGTILFGFVVLGAETLGRNVFGSETAALIVLASPTFLIASATSVSRAKMMRRLDFKVMSRTDSSQILGGTACTVVLAAFGLGARAVILGALASSLIDMLMQFYYFRPVLPGWSSSSARGIFGFGSYASINGLGVTLSANIDYIILSLYLSPAAVGIYYRAFQFGVNYQSKITVVLQKMLFPLMSRAESKTDLRRIRERAVEFNAMTALPLLGLVIVLAPYIVPLLYGHRWIAAVRPTQILTVAGMATVINTGSDAPALSLGRPRAVLFMTLTFFVTYTVGLVIAAHFGLIAACLAAAAIHVLGMFGAQRYLIDKVIGLPFYQFALDTGPAIVATAAAMGVTEGEVHLLAGAGSLLVIVVGGMVGLAAYAAAMRIIFPGRARRLGGTLLRVARSRTTANQSQT